MPTERQTDILLESEFEFKTCKSEAMNNNNTPADVQLPEEITNQINQEAEKYGFVVPYDGGRQFYNHDKCNGYVAGATAWAIWKQKYDELKAHSAVWVKASERMPAGKMRDLPLKYKGKCYSGDFLYDYYFNFPFGAVGVDYDGNRSPQELEDVEWLDESGATDLQAELEQLRRWKKEAISVMSPVLDYAQKHGDIKLGHSCTDFVLNRCKDYDQLKERAGKMEAALKNAVPALESAKVAIAFADWIKHSAKGYDPICEKWVYGEDELRYSTAELYDIFKQQKPGSEEKEADKKAIEIKSGLKFCNIHMEGSSFEVVKIYDNKRLEVKITMPNGDYWNECDWVLEHTQWAFEKGEYFIEKEVDNG